MNGGIAGVSPERICQLAAAPESSRKTIERSSSANPRKTAPESMLRRTAWSKAVAAKSK
jgi:hypothetical protein